MLNSITGLFISRESLSQALPPGEVTYQLAITAIILLIGFGLAKVSSRVMRRVWRHNGKKQMLEENDAIKFVKWTIMTVAILVALIFLQGADGLSKIYAPLPAIASILLITVFGIGVIYLLTHLLAAFLRRIGVQDYLALHESEHLLEPILSGVRILLYLILFEMILSYQGIRLTPASTMMIGALYVGVVILAVLGLHSQAKNLVGMLYLTALRNFSVGHRITLGKQNGEIRRVSLLHTEILLNKNKILHVPNAKLAEESFILEKKHLEIDTLEEVKSYYVAQHPSFCGPACAEIILKVFGYVQNQETIGKMCGTKVGLGTHPQVLIDAIEKLTEGQVRGVWISYEFITRLESELESWLDQGALCIVDYKKDFLFPTGPKAHYAVCLGVQDNELLILDPSRKKGGVYLVESKKIERGMDTYSKLIKGRRGYIVLAPEGTSAFWRLDNNLIYSDLGLYTGLSKGIERKLIGLLKKKKVSKLIPDVVKKYLHSWEKTEENIFRLWHPDDESTKAREPIDGSGPDGE